MPSLLASSAVCSASSSCESSSDSPSDWTSSPVSPPSASSLFWFSVSPLLVLSTSVDSLEEPPPITVSSAGAAWASLAMACEIGGMTSDSTRLKTEAPHKTPASTRRVALLLCLDLSEFAFIDVSSPRDRDPALSPSNLGAQPIIARARYAYYYSLFKQHKPNNVNFTSRCLNFLTIIQTMHCFSRVKFRKDAGKLVSKSR